MDANDETGAKLGERVCNLSEVLQRVSKTSRESEQNQTGQAIGELQT